MHKLLKITLKVLWEICKIVYILLQETKLTLFFLL